jgi:hypothetical protein
VLHQLGSLAWELSWVSLSLLLLLFPNGRLPSRRWRPAVWVVIAAVGTALTVLFLPGPAVPGLPANPLGVEPLGAALRFAYDAGYALLAAVVLAAIVSLVARFRRAAGAERQQLKWFAYGTSMLALLGMLGVVTGERGVEGVAGPVAGALAFPVLVSGVPVAIGVAVLKYRLYDIDRLINRTLVYGLLTAILGLGYAGTVLVLGPLFGGVARNPPSWAVAGATLTSQPCSSRPATASRESSIGASTAASTTRPRPSRRSPPGCATRSTWTRSRPSCSRWSIRQCNRPPRPCGCDQPAHRQGAPGPRLPTRRLGRCSLDVYQACELARCRSVVPSCTRSFRGVAARPVSKPREHRGSGPVRSRTPAALRSSAARDRIGRPGTARPITAWARRLLAPKARLGGIVTCDGGERRRSRLLWRCP